MSTRSLLKSHTVDLIRPRWEQHKATLGDLVTTAHDPDASDEQAEDAALAFLEDWSRHPVYRKTARYGFILHALRHRPELAGQVAAFGEVVDRVGATSGGLEGWYAARFPEAVTA